MERRGTVELLLNFGHFLDHLFLLIFATAVLALTREWNRSYEELLPLTTGALVAFGAGSIPAGWLADKWSRHGTMVVFFVGIGAASILTGFARTPFELAAGLTLIGLFAAIYHPVGTAMLVANTQRIGRTLGVNGVWGNFGLAFAALITGAFIDLWNWRAAFVIPGVVSIAAGVWFARLEPQARPAGAAKKAGLAGLDRALIVRIFLVMAVAVALSSVIFNATTYAMPKIFDERLRDLTTSATGIGVLVCITYCIAAMAQLMVGWFIDRYPLKRVFVLIGPAQVILMLAAGQATGATMLALTIGMMFFVFAQIPINDAMIAKYTAEEWRARAYSLRYVVSFTAGATALQVISGAQAAGGFALLFTVLAAASAAIFVAALFFPGSMRAGPAVVASPGKA